MTIYSKLSSHFPEIVCYLYIIVTLFVRGYSYSATNVNTNTESIFKYGKYMDSYVMQDFYNYGPKMCFLACVQLCGCTGINFQNINIHCELLRSSIDDQFVSKQGFRSSELATWTIDNNVCWPNPCSMHQKCIISRHSTPVCINIPLNYLRLKNVALFKPSQQSSTDSNYVATHAVDGRLDTLSHTSNSGQNYWRVDLLRVYKIHRIEIVNTPAYGYRLRDLDVKIGWDLDIMELCNYYKGPGADGERIILPCSKLMIGQYVKLTMLLQSTDNYLHFSEVEVYGYEL